MNTIFDKVQARWDDGARVCIGLDSEHAKLPRKLQHLPASDGQMAFNAAIIRTTHDLALAYKINAKFYIGSGGRTALMATCAMIHEIAPTVPIIIDDKYGDIGNTLRGSVLEAFGHFGADLVTANPYLGGEALKPFIDLGQYGTFVLCKTSNSGSGEFQDLEVRVVEDGVTMIRPLYQEVARRVSKGWNALGNCGLVVGATYPAELAAVRKIVGDDMWLLLPGVGTQEGDLEAAMKAGLSSRKSGIIVNSSSGIIFASSENDYADQARAATILLTNKMNKVLAGI